jgi:phosphate butyryltransferase
MLGFSILFDHLRNKPPVKLVLANGVDEHSLEALAMAVKLGFVSAIITGNKTEIDKKCVLAGLVAQDYLAVHCKNPLTAVKKAVEIASAGQADIIMKGLVNTDDFMRAILDKENGLLPPGALLTHVSMIKNNAYHKPLFVSDVAIIPEPTLDQKVKMTKYLINIAGLFGIKKPRVAFIAATEKVISKMSACDHADKLTRMWEHGEFPESLCHGPMGLDLAIDNEAVAIKNFESEVAGDADCLLFPNIEAGNVFYKTNSRLCNSQLAAMVVGTTVPAVLSSRGDSVETKLNSIAFAAMLK